MVASCLPPTRDLACNPGLCPDWDSNRQPYDLQAGAQATEPHQPGLVKKIDTQVQKAQRVPNEMNPKRPIPRHIKIKLPKVKTKREILKAEKEKQLVTGRSYKGAPLRLSADFQQKLCRPEEFGMKY